MSLKVGDTAPEFTLKSHEIKDISLASFRGKKVVLLFFPLVNTGVCEKEMCSTRDSMKQYENLEAQVFGISVDSPFAQQLWDAKHNFSFPLLSDFNKEVSRQYGILYETFAPGKLDFQGVAKRSAFVLDRQGVVRHTEVLENPGEEPNYQNILEALQKIE